MMPDAAFDSWLTVGITEGAASAGTGALSSIGVPFMAVRARPSRPGPHQRFP
jgi:hypothetical protein